MEAIKLSARAEDYLLAISLLRENGLLVKISDISKILNIKAPSVTEAVEKLSDAGLVKHNKHSNVELTVRGAVIAEDIYQRYETLRKLLSEILNVPPEVAERDAKGMKYALSKISRERIAKLVEGISEKQPVRGCLQ